MKTCPTCGNRYRPDVTECPNDGTSLAAGPTALAPPPAAPPRPASKPVPAPAIRSYDDISAGLTEKTTAGSWIFALVACGLLIGGYLLARDHLLGEPEQESVEASGDDRTAKGDKKKRQKRKRRAASGEARSNEQAYDDYDWEQDYEADDLVLGDVLSQRREEIVDERQPLREPPPYEPSRDEWQPSGAYRPTAKWSEPGANSNVVEIDLSAPSHASPLDESQVKQVLSVRKLAPCYDPWVQKIPQMRGRVHMTFVVAGDGHVASVTIDRSQLRSRVVERCLVHKARGFRFPAAAGGAKTRFDTHFDFTNR